MPVPGNQSQLADDDRVDRGATASGVRLAHPVADEAQVRRVLEVAVAVILRDGVLDQDGDVLIEAAGLGGAAHDGLLGSEWRLSTALSLGRVVAPADLTPEAARHSVLAIPGDPGFRAVALLERLAAGNRPIPRG